MKKSWLFAFALVFALLTAAVTPKILSHLERQREIVAQQNAHIPPPERPASSASSALPVVSSVAARTSVNWNVPFTPQAPLGNWDHLHEEACEEASVLMALRFFEGTDIGTPDQAEAAIQKLVADNVALGYADDDTAQQVTVLIHHENSSLIAKVVDDPTVDQIKEFLAAGTLVIVPAQGQFLKNPYFTAPGPKYHMLVIKGYTETTFITDDPGTKHGKDYVYDFDRLMSAVHDWNGGQVETGARRVIVVSK